MPWLLRSRLSLMMFGQYAIMGAWSVTLPTYLKAAPFEGGLHLPATDVGLIYGTLAIAATVTPLFVGLLADRLFATQRVLAVLHGFGFILLLLLALRTNRHQQQIEETFEKIAQDTWWDDHENLLTLRTEETICHQTIDPNWTFVDSSAARRKNWWHSVCDTFYHHVTGRGQSKSGTDTTWLTSRWDKFYHHLTGRGQYASLEQLKLRVASITPDEAAKRIGEIKSRIALLLPEAYAAPDLLDAQRSASREVFFVMMSYALVFAPTLTLTSAVTLRNVADPARHFGTVRVWGTYGWAVSGLFLGRFVPAVSPAPLVLAAAASGLMALFSLTLPHTPPAGKAKTIGETLGLPALKLFIDPSFRALTLATVLATIAMSFHNVFTNTYLVALNIPNAAGWQTTGQVSEVALLLMLPFIRSRLGTRGTLLTGLLANTIRFVVYAVASATLMVAVGLPLHGVGYTLFFVSALLDVDRRAPADLRASAQGLLALLNTGLAGLAGNLLAGWAVEYFTADGRISWPAVWTVPALISGLAFVVFAVLFRNSPVEATRDPDLPRSPQL